MRRIELETLGRLALCVDGEDVPGISNRPVRAALLVYVAIEGEVTRDAAQACIWPHDPTDRARRSLNQTLYLLRRDIGDGWLHAAGSYLRRTSRLRVDGVRFADAVEAADYETALELYCGPFLRACHLASSSDFQQWVDRQRDRLAALHRIAREGAIDRLLSSGDHHRALRVAREWAAMSPLEEEPRRHLIRLHASAGARGEALRQYDELACLLDAEGLEPLPETRALIRKVRELSDAMPASISLPPVRGRAPPPHRRRAVPRSSLLAAVAVAAVAVAAVIGSLFGPWMRPGSSPAHFPDSASVVAPTGGAPGLRNGSSPPPPVDGEAYRVHLRGQGLLHRLDVQRSIHAYDSAIAVDSTFAPAFAGLAQASFLGGFFGLLPRALAWPRARDAASRALQWDPAIAAAHTTLGYLALYDDWDWERAEAELITALRLDRNDVLARHGYADILTFRGNLAEGLRQVQLALEVDPLSPLLNGTYAGHLYVAGDFPRLLREISRIRALVGDAAFGADFAASALWELGRFDEAVTEYRRIWSTDPALVRKLELTLRLEGPESAMRAAGDQVASRWEPGRGSAHLIARLYARAGAADEAFLWIERAYQERRPQFLHLTAYPEFDDLRSDRRYEAILERIGLRPPGPV